jgi:hypothetical protein
MIGGGMPLTFANQVLPEPGANLTSPVSGTVVDWRIIDAAGGPFKLRVLHPAAGGAFTGAGTSSPGTPMGLGVQLFSTNLPIQAGDLIALDDTSTSDTIGIANTGAVAEGWRPQLADGATRAPVLSASSVEIGFNADVRPVSNLFSFGSVKRNKSKGTATLTATVPDPGPLVLFGKGLKKFTTSPSAPGDVKLLVKPKGKVKKKLNEDGKAKVKAKITFSPSGIGPGTQTKKLTLRKHL